MSPCSLARLAVALGALALPATAAAHPEGCAAGKTAAGAFTFEAASFGPSDDESKGDVCYSAAQVARFDDSAATAESGDVSSSPNVSLLANLPKTGPFAGEPAFNSDLAFWGDYAIQGNYQGFQITDISNPSTPRVVSQTSCPGSQNDVSVWRNLIITSTDSRRSDASCNSFALSSTTTPSSTDPNAEYWEGIKIFDWSNPRAPRLVKAVETDCGSHTHTIVPQAGRLVVYVSSYDVNANAKDCRATGSKFDHDKISIVNIPLERPTAARVVAEPVLFPDGGFPGTQGTRETRGCHDITVFPAIKLAAGACMGQGIVMDITDPVEPDVIASVTDPNFAFWHSATFFNDGKAVLFTDELGGGGQPTCNETVGPNRGANVIYDLPVPSGPVFRGYFKIPRTQANTENCVAHNGVFLSTPDNDTYFQAWYQGGTSVVDLDDPANAEEVGFFDRGPLSDTRLILGGSWSSYWYNGHIYSNDIQKGLDVLQFDDPRTAGAARLPYLNAQVQEPLR